MININLQIGSILDNAQDIKNFVGDHIYPVTIPQKKKDAPIHFPVITYSRKVSPPILLEKVSEAAQIIIHIYSESYKESVQIAEAVKAEMGSNDILLEGCEEDFFFPAYFQRLTFKKEIN